MKEKVSLTTMTITFTFDDDDRDFPFESANDGLFVTWEVVDPEYGRVREPDPWESHDWTSDYDYPDEYTPEHDEDFE